MPSAKQQPSNIKHSGGIRPNVWVLTFAPPPPVLFNIFYVGVSIDQLLLA